MGQLLPRDLEHLQHSRWSFIIVRCSFFLHRSSSLTGRFSVSGPYVDQSGVSLISGGGTLVLGSHDSVSVRLGFKSTWGFTLRFRFMVRVGKTSLRTQMDPFFFIVSNDSFLECFSHIENPFRLLHWDRNFRESFVLSPDNCHQRPCKLGLNHLNFSSGWPVAV